MKFTPTSLLLASVSLVSVALAPSAHAADPVPEPVPAAAPLAATPTGSIQYLSRPRPSLPASWKWSLAPLVASQGLDIASSYGMRELNPILAGSQGEFGVRSTLTKVAVTAAFVGLEYLIVRAHPGAARIFTRMNWGGAALTTGFAAHNFSIR